MDARWWVAGLLAAISCATAGAQATREEKCPASKDLVVQALETAGPQGTPKNFADALQLLKRASSMCSESGDAWYYRSLIERRLGNAGAATFSIEQARLVGSDAMTQGLQPFTLATPAATPGRRGTGDAAAGSGVNQSTVAQKWALVIGITKFSDRALPPLQFTAADANSFAALLGDPALGKFPKDHVHTLTDEKATTRAIKEQLNWIARMAGPNDMVVIYLATHGTPRTTDKVGQLNYILTYDTVLKSTETPDQDALYATALPMVDLSNAVATRVHALRTLVVLDTCYSGGSLKNGSLMMGKLKNAAPSAATLQRMSEGSGRIIFAASRDDQESLESVDLRHGYFTYYLLKRLTESKGITPLTQVFNTVQKDVSDRVAKDGAEDHLQQNPVMEQSKDDADFALGIATGAQVAGVAFPPKP